MTPSLLTQETLDRFEDALRHQRWPGLERRRPGLTDDDIDALTAPLGLRLPSEARMWWRWHDGISAEDVLVRAFCGFAYLPLQEAVEECRAMRRIAAETLALDTPDGWGAEYWWRPSWLPITIRDTGRVIACDCSRPEDAPTPILAVRWAVEDHSVWDTPRVGSLGELVRAWSEALESGVWVYDPQANRWERDDERAERDVSLSELL